MCRMAEVQEELVFIEEQIAPPPVAPVQVIDLDPEPTEEEEDPEEEMHEVPDDGPQQNEMEEAMIQLGAMIHYLMDQNNELLARLQISEDKVQNQEEQIQGLHEERHGMENIMTASNDYIHHLEGRLDECKRQKEMMNFVYIHSMERVQTAVWNHPQELGQTRYSISRARVMAITEEERVRSITPVRDRDI